MRLRALPRVFVDEPTSPIATSKGPRSLHDGSSLARIAGMPSEHRDEGTQRKKKTTSTKRPSHRIGRGGFSGRAATPRAKKRRAGTTHVTATPLRIHVAGAKLDATEKEKVRERLGRRLWRYGGDITQAHVRFTDINGPRGGVDTVCRIKLSVAGLAHLVVEARDVDALSALRRASLSARNALVRAMERRGRSATPIPGERAPHVHPPPPPRRPAGGSLIGRRVGRSHENLERTAEKPERGDSWVDTSLPGVSATDRKAGGGSTAARNVRLRARRAGATLEDSARTRPSRKSTRKSANRQKAASKLARKAKRKLHAPSARARRARASR